MSASTTRPIQYSALQTGWFKEVRVKDLDGHSVRALLASRELLVKIKREEPRSCDRPCQVQCLCYGDSWWCSVVLEAMYPAIQGIPYPSLDGGAEAGPPEESGGVWGVEELVGALRDPRHERYEEAVEHLGEDYNPEDYDADATAQALAALVKRPARSRKKTSPTIEN